MKKIDLKSIDIQKLSDVKVKRKMDLQVMWKRGKQFFEKHWGCYREKFLYFLSQFNFIQRTAFILYVLIFCGIFFTLFFTIPVLTKIFGIQGDIATTKANLIILQSDLSSLKNIDSELKNIRANIVKMGKMVPEKPEEENMIVTIGTLIAGNYLVSPSRISWNQEKENMIDNEEIRDRFDVYSYSFTTQGTYENVQNFISMLRKNLRVIDVKSIKMVPLTDGNIDAAFLVWTYNLRSANPDADTSFEE